MKEASPAKSVDEDAESLRSQVDFLNSVIVDMQRKNDDLKSKFEHLESAVGVFDDFGVDTEDMVMLNGIDKKKPAPRMFCDICDEFDLHDTEDCPTQAMPIIDDHPEETHTKSHAKRGAVREYCDNCEMFGHSSENCDAGETY
jgi:CAP-Gly domain-containing linker protein 1